MKGWSKFAKASFLGVLAFLNSVVTAMVDGGFGDVTDAQWLWAVIAALSTSGAVYGITAATSGRGK